MKYIDLDQPSRNDSAGADSANGSEHPGQGQLESPQNAQPRSRNPGPAGEFNFTNVSMAAPQQAAQSLVMATILQRVVGAVGLLVGSQQQATSQLIGKMGAISAPGRAQSVNPLAKPVTPSQQGHKPAEAARANYTPWGRYEKKPVEASASSDSGQSRYQARPAAVKMGSPDSESETQQMDHRSRKIVNHENKHSAVLRDSSYSADDAKPRFVEQQGPDGRKYAVGGEVNTDLRPIPGNPDATEKKAESVYRSAIGDSDRSESDNEAARRAMFAAQEARRAKAMKRAESGDGSMESPYGSAKPVRMGSPYSVKMRSPAALIPLIGRGIAAVGGFAARGAAAAGGYAARGAVAVAGRGSAVGRGIRRGVIAARRFGRRAASNGDGAQQAIANVTDSLTGLNPVVGTLTKTVKMLESETANAAVRLKNFSAALAIQAAQNNVNRLNQSLQQGQRLGPGLAEYERQRGRIDMATGNIQADVIAIFLPLVTAIANGTATLLEIGSGISALIAQGFKSVGELAQTIVENIPFLKLAGTAAEDIKKWIKQWLPPQANGDFNVKNLNDLFTMPIPGPGQAPQLRGRMNMPLPQARPQPFPMPLAAGN